MNSSISLIYGLEFSLHLFLGRGSAVHFTGEGYSDVAARRLQR
jgi:hypothetical protein